MLGSAFERQPGHFFAGSGHRPATVVAAGDASEAGNMLSEKANDMGVIGHGVCNSRDGQRPFLGL